jgi:hypothetical protein
MSDGGAASIHARLLAKAKQRGDEFQLVLTRYGLERFLYRLSQSPARDTFWLKGAMLFDLWFNVPLRPTRDADFLGLGAADSGALHAAASRACEIDADDGMSFDAATIRIAEIRESASYGGLRVTLLGNLGRARCPVQLDVGYGDAVTPGPDEAIYPTLLDDMPAPTLRVYPRASVMAEKMDAIVSLGMANTRMKDYFDLLALTREGAVTPALLTDALVATLGRRRTTLPDGLPLGLAEDFAQDIGKQRQWSAFLTKSRLDAPALDAVVSELRAALQAPLAQAVARLRARG